MLKRVFVAAIAAALVSTDVQAQFTEVAGFRVRGKSTGSELYAKVGADLGATPRFEYEGAYALLTPYQFRLFYDASEATLAFSWAGFTGAASGTKTLTAVPNAFNAIRLGGRGQSTGTRANDGIRLDNVTYNGAGLMGLFLTGNTYAEQIFGGVDAGSDFEVLGTLTMQSVTGSDVGNVSDNQRFEINIGTATGDFSNVPGAEVPEPASLALLVTGLAVLSLAARRRRA